MLEEFENKSLEELEQLYRDMDQAYQMTINPILEMFFEKSLEVLEKMIILKREQNTK